MTTEVTQAQYIERWENALRVLNNIPPEHVDDVFDMGTWGELTSCGTKACLGGHCALDPWFNAQGFVGEFIPQVTKPMKSKLEFTGIHPEPFFGERGYYTIFVGGVNSHDEVREATEELLTYLKADGDANRRDDDDDEDDPDSGFEDDTEED